MQEGDLVLCTVVKIEGTSVFVKLRTGEEGTIITSEIAPGRIRNIREYVVPNKKIVCKVLRVLGNHIDLSLRRVTSKERKEIMDKVKQEHIAKSAFNQILKEKSGQTEKMILENFNSLYDFMLNAKEDEFIIKKYIPQEFQEQIKKVTQKKQKNIEVKKTIFLKCLEKDGIIKIKKILSQDFKNVKITYISAGQFQIKIKDENYKKANHEMDFIIKKIEQLSKQNSCEFELKE